MFQMKKSTPLVNDMVISYLKTKGCVFPHGERIKKGVTILRINDFKQFHTSIGINIDTPLSQPHNIFTYNLDYKVWQVGNYRAYVKGKTIHVSVGDKFTKRQLDLALRILNRDQNEMQYRWNGRTVRFDCEQNMMKIGCTWVERETLEEMKKEMES